jgi:hypothetical protein
MGDFASIDRVAMVMPGSVLYVGDKGCIRRTLRAQLIQNSANRMNHFQIGFFIPAADIVSFPNPTLLQYQAQGTRMIIHIQPVADVVALAING